MNFSATLSNPRIRTSASLDRKLVMFDKVAKIMDCSKVIIDDRKAAQVATQHIIDIGCKKIAHFRGPLMRRTQLIAFWVIEMPYVKIISILIQPWSIYVRI